MRAHVIENGRVINTIIVESLDCIPNLVDAEQGGNIGDLWNGQIFIKPPRYASAQDAQDDKISALAAYSYDRETAGITVEGVVIRTDRESQAMVAGAKIYSDLNPEALIDWCRQT